MNKFKRKSSICFNCQTPLVNQENFCPSCGQQNRSTQASIKHLASDFLQDYFGFDSKIWNSFRPLLFAPGKMTKDYLEGKRNQFIPPIRLFLFLSFLYFGLSYLIDSDWSEAIIVDGEIKPEQDLQGFYDSLAKNINWTLFLFVPIQAWLTMLLFRSKERRYYVNFFVWTLHVFSLILIIGLLKTAFTGLVPVESSEALYLIYEIFLLSMLGYILVYAGLSLHRVFAKKYTWLRFLLLLVISLTLYLFLLLFWILLLAWDHQLAEGITI